MFSLNPSNTETELTNMCLAEFKTGQERKDVAEHTLTAYKAAQDIADSELRDQDYPLFSTLSLLLKHSQLNGFGNSIVFVVACHRLVQFEFLFVCKLILNIVVSEIPYGNLLLLVYIRKGLVKIENMYHRRVYLFLHLLGVSLHC